MNQLMVIEPEQFETTQRVAKAMVASGYFNDAKDVAQAIVKIMAGQEIGLPAFASMSGIHIIQGKPTLGANAMATLIKNDGRYNYRVVKHDDKVCQIEFYEDGEKCGVSEFTIADAKKAGTKNLAKFPKNMLFARALSNGAKWHTPGIFGGAPIYTPEELGADIDDEGEIIDITPEPVILVDSKVEYDVEPEPQAPESVGESLISDKQRRQLHAVGTELYGKGWNDKRAEMTAAFELKSSNEWTASQAVRVIDGMNGKLRDAATEAENVALFEQPSEGFNV